MTRAIVVVLVVLLAAVVIACKEDAEQGWVIANKYFTTYEPLEGRGPGGVRGAELESRLTREAEARGVDTRIHMWVVLKNGMSIHWAHTPRVPDSLCYTTAEVGQTLRPDCRYLATKGGAILEPGTGPP